MWGLWFCELDLDSAAEAISRLSSLKELSLWYRCWGIPLPLSFVSRLPSALQVRQPTEHDRL